MKWNDDLLPKWMNYECDDDYLLKKKLCVSMIDK